MPRTHRKPVLYRRSPLPAVHTIEGATVSRKQFAGVSVPATVVPDLQRACEFGFVVSASDDGTALVIYPPDKTQRPIRWGSRKSNPAHESNLRAELRRAGLPDPDTIDLTEGATMPRPRKTASSPTSIAEAALNPAAAVSIAFRPGDKWERARREADDAMRTAGIPEGVIALIHMLEGTAMEWHRIHRTVENEVESEAVKAAEDLAEECEGRAVRAERSLERMTSERDELAGLYKAERDRANEQQARADALEAAIAPLRKILGGG